MSAFAKFKSVATLKSEFLSLVNAFHVVCSTDRAEDFLKGEFEYVVQIKGVACSSSTKVADTQHSSGSEQQDRICKYLTDRFRACGLCVEAETVTADGTISVFLKVGVPESVASSFGYVQEFQTQKSPIATPKSELMYSKPIQDYKAKRWADLMNSPAPVPDNQALPAPPLAIACRQRICRKILASIPMDQEAISLGLGGMSFLDSSGRLLPLLAQCQQTGAVVGVFPLHDQRAKEALYKKWILATFQAVAAPGPAQKARALFSQPFADVRDYFGEKVTMYFLWLGYYTQSLVIPALLGLLLWFFQDNDLLTFLYAVFLIVWAAGCLEGWKRRQAEVAFLWDLDGDDAIEDEVVDGEIRNFIGKHLSNKDQTQGSSKDIEDAIRGWTLASWRRRLKHFTGLAALIAMLSLVLAGFIGCKIMQDWMGRSKWAPLSFIPTALFVMLTTVSRKMYAEAAQRINVWEDHRSWKTRENALIVKLFLFEFVAWYFGPMYIAFWLQDLPLLRAFLRTQLLVTQTVQQLQEVGLPLFSTLRQKAAQAPTELQPIASTEDRAGTRPDAAAPTSKLSQVAMESQLEMYDDTFEDHLEMAVQFGYVILFGSAFPLAPLLALLNNIIEIRSDAFKLCTSFRKPDPKRVGNIGNWLWVLEAVVSIAVITNVALIFTFFIPGPDPAALATCSPLTCLLHISRARLLLAMATEHVLLFIKFGIDWIIPDVPLWIRIARLPLSS